MGDSAPKSLITWDALYPMQPQAYAWTCSVCSFTWTAQATGIEPALSRPEATALIGYPDCVNPTLGLTDIQCLLDAYGQLGVAALQSWVTFDQAYAICQKYTGVINPVGMYHVMAIRGVDADMLWVANSAQGYRGVYDHLTRNQFNALGPVQIVAMLERTG